MEGKTKTSRKLNLKSFVSIQYKLFSRTVANLINKQVQHEFVCKIYSS